MPRSAHPICLATLLLAALAIAACAARQRVDLSCVPREMTIYLDGETLDANPGALELLADRPHTLFFKGGGYQTEMVVLDSRESAEGPRLEPADPCAEIRFVAVRRDLELSVEDPAP